MRFVRCSANVSSTDSITPRTVPTIPYPPSTFNHTAQFVPRSVALISERWPELSDLAANGTVIAIPRPEDYAERRSDGYQEPELVLVVGTAHLSVQSAEDVTRVVAATRPQNVVVELCKSRSAQLYESPDIPSSSTTANSSSKSNNQFSLSGGNFLESFQRTIALGGRSALLLRLFLGQLSSKLSAEVGVQSGAEFRAAQVAAEAINAQIVLGDRPIEVTLRRAWDALPVASRWRLAGELLEGVRGAQSAGGAVAAAQAVEQLKDDDAVSVMLSALANRYPEAIAPLVYERDLYFAWSLKRSKAVNGTTVVVGVCGRGHLRGVCYALTTDSGELRFRDLAGSRKSKGAGKKGVAKAVAKVAVESVLFGAVIYAWSQIQWN